MPESQRQSVRPLYGPHQVDHHVPLTHNHNANSDWTLSGGSSCTTGCSAVRYTLPTVVSYAIHEPEVLQLTVPGSLLTSTSKTTSQVDITADPLTRIIDYFLIWTGGYNGGSSHRRHLSRPYICRQGVDFPSLTSRRRGRNRLRWLLFPTSAGSGLLYEV